MFVKALNQMKAELTHMRTFFNEVSIVEVDVQQEDIAPVQEEAVIVSEVVEVQVEEIVEETIAPIEEEPVVQESPNHDIWTNKKNKKKSDFKERRLKVKNKKKEERLKKHGPFKNLSLRDMDIDIRVTVDEYDMSSSTFEFEDEELNELCRMKDEAEKKT